MKDNRLVKEVIFGIMEGQMKRVETVQIIIG